MCLMIMTFCPTWNWDFSFSTTSFCINADLSLIYVFYVAGCFKLTSCNANTANQNIHAYGIMLIVSSALHFRNISAGSIGTHTAYMIYFLENKIRKIWKSFQKLSFRISLTMFCTLLNSVVYLRKHTYKLADGTSENKHQKHDLKFMLVNCSCRQL